MKNWTKHHPLLWLVACFILGIPAADHIPFPLIPALIISCICCLLLFWRPHIIWGLFLFFVLGGMWTSLRFLPAETAGPPPSQSNSAELVITAPVQFVREGLRVSADLLVAANKETERQRIPTRLNVYHGVPKLMTGDVVRIWGRIVPVGGFRNFGASDPRRQLQREGINRLVRVESGKAVVVAGKLKGFWPSRPIESLRYKLRSFLSPSPLIRALLIGDRSGLSESTTEAFRRAGLAHMLAISGQHVGLVALVFFLLFRGLLCLFPRIALWVPLQKLAWFGAWFPAAIYVGLAGFPVSAVRALVILTVFVIAFLSQRSRDLWSALAMAALVILLIDPSSLFSVSFQLSFVAVAALILFLGKTRHGFVAKLFSLFWASVAVTFLTAPLLAYYFHAVPLAGLLANIVVLPLLACVVLPLSLLTGIVSLFSSSAGHFLLGPTTMSVELLTHIASFFAGLKLVIPLSLRPVQVVLYYLAFLLWFLPNLQLRKFAYRIIAVVCALIILLGAEQLFFYRSMTGKLQLTVLDVGQGDAMILRLPSGDHYLIDGGGFYIPRDMRKYRVTDIGERVILPHMRRYGITSLKGVILTHAHPDHYGGLISVLRQIPAENFYWNGDYFADSSFQELIQILQEQKVHLHQINDTAAPINKDSVRIHWLNPHAGIKSDINNRSLVMKIDYGHSCFLLTGDIEAEIEKRLVGATHASPLRCDVLKVPHHGSQTSSTQAFLDAVAPKYAVISVREHNPFGQPAPDVLRRYRENGVALWRTDKRGAIRVSSDGEKIEVEAVVPFR